jgi:predicted PurR-regulated permease PerM
MPLFDTRRQRAALLILLLGVGLAAATAPYTTGILGAPVIVVLFAPLHRWLSRRLPAAVAAGLAILTAVLVVALPSAGLAALVVAQAPDIIAGLRESPLLTRLDALSIAGIPLGPRLRTLGDQLISWLATNALSVVGNLTRTVLNLVIALFGAYFLFLRTDAAWRALRPFIPFSDENVQRLRKRFGDVTNSTVIGVVLVAVAQGGLLGAMFALLGLSNPVFWGIVTAILSILPVVGSGLVWVPACARLAVDGRWGATLLLAVWGMAIVGSADNVIRPIVYRRWANIHPLVTLVGALAGIRWFGLLGILVGPLAMSYFFALIDMYSEEYMEPSEQIRRRTGEMRALALPPAPPEPGNPGDQIR